MFKFCKFVCSPVVGPHLKPMWCPRFNLKFLLWCLCRAAPGRGDLQNLKENLHSYSFPSLLIFTRVYLSISSCWNKPASFINSFFILVFEHSHETKILRKGVSGVTISYMVYLSGVSIWCIYLMYLSDVSIWCIYLMYPSGVSTWCNYLMYLSCVYVWVHLSGIKAQGLDFIISWAPR